MNNLDLSIAITFAVMHEVYTRFPIPQNRSAVENRTRKAYLVIVPQGSMAINAPVISGSDPGAVPGGSTRTHSLAGLRGRNRIDGRLKGIAFAR